MEFLAREVASLRMAVGEVYRMVMPYFSIMLHQRFGYGWLGAPSYIMSVAPLMSGP